MPPPKLHCNDGLLAVRPFVAVPPQHQSTIEPHEENFMARFLDLSRVNTLRDCPLLVSSKNSKSVIPLHAICGHDTWHANLHAIKFYWEMSHEKQQAERNRTGSFSQAQIDLLHDNRNRLMANRPPPLLDHNSPRATGIVSRPKAKLLSPEQRNILWKNWLTLIYTRPPPLLYDDLPLTGMSKQWGESQLLSLVESSAKRSLSSRGSIASKILGNNTKNGNGNIKTSTDDEILVLQPKPALLEETIVKEELEYECDTDEDEDFPKNSAVTPPPVLSSSEMAELGGKYYTGVKIKEEDGYETDDVTSFPGSSLDQMKYQRKTEMNMDTMGNDRADRSLSGDYNQIEESGVVQPPTLKKIDNKCLNPGCRVIVMCNEGYPWRATILKSCKKGYRIGYMVHYDRRKRSSERWAPKKYVVGFIPGELGLDKRSGAFNPESEKISQPSPTMECANCACAARREACGRMLEQKDRAAHDTSYTNRSLGFASVSYGATNYCNKRCIHKEACSVNNNRSNIGSKPAELSQRPKNLRMLWREFKFGLGGRMPAEFFSAHDIHAKKNRKTYFRRSHVWRCIQLLLQFGLAPESAILRIRSVYGQHTGIGTIIDQMIADKNKYMHRGGLHPELVGGLHPKLLKERREEGLDSPKSAIDWYSRTIAERISWTTAPDLSESNADLGHPNKACKDLTKKKEESMKVEKGAENAEEAIPIKCKQACPRKDSRKEKMTTIDSDGGLAHRVSSKRIRPWKDGTIVEPSKKQKILGATVEGKQQNLKQPSLGANGTRNNELHEKTINVNADQIKVDNEAKTPVLTTLEQRKVRMQIAKNCIQYFDRAKHQALALSPKIYNELVKVINVYKLNEIDTVGLICYMMTILDGHKDLILGINTFLPEKYKIDEKDLESTCYS